LKIFHVEFVQKGITAIDKIDGNKRTIFLGENRFDPVTDELRMFQFESSVLVIVMNTFVTHKLN